MKTYTINNTQITSEAIQKLIAENPEILEVKKDGKTEEWTKYWYIGTWNNVFCATWLNDKYDKYRRDIGNFFLTEEGCIAQQEVNFAIARVRAYIKDNDLGREYKAGKSNYYIYSRGTELSICSVCNINDLPLPGYFKSNEACKQVIDNNTADLKLIYGIK